MILAWIDTRPFLFVLGIPIVILLTFLGCAIVKSRVRRWKASAGTLILYVLLFAFFLYGPFIGQTKTREYMMSWEIKPPHLHGEANQGTQIKVPEVIFSFIEFPEHFIGYHSIELADHLKTNGKDEVKALIEITSDYGKVRGYSVLEIVGAKSWPNEGIFGGSSGSPQRSPWD
ncbi:hypothetical protein OAF75_03365 [Verrucomicrobiales bacterium]|nr:hypothetical protein [Verrucomicrobiales bacterium]